MRYIPALKCLFPQVPKCGGTSMGEMLNMAFPQPENRDAKIRWFQEPQCCGIHAYTWHHLEPDAEWGFIIIRDPYTWHKSYWKDIHKRESREKRPVPDYRAQFEHDHVCNPLANCDFSTFEKYMRDVTVKHPSWCTKFYKGYTDTRGTCGEIMVLRLEGFGLEVKQLEKRLGREFVPVHRNYGRPDFDLPESKNDEAHWRQVLKEQDREVYETYYPNLL